MESGLLSTAESAALVGVDPTVIRQWASRHQLPRAGVTASGRPLYHPRAVAAAEAATRLRAGRTALTAAAAPTAQAAPAAGTAAGSQAAAEHTRAAA